MQRGSGQLETWLGEASFPPCLPRGSTRNPPHGKKSRRGAQSRRLPLLRSRRGDPATGEVRGSLRWAPRQGRAARREAASPPLPHCCFSSPGQVGRWQSAAATCGASSRGPRPRGHGGAGLDPAARKGDQEALVHWQLSLSEIPESHAAFANPARS